MQGKKIILICDSTYNNYSGGKVARYLVDLLNSAGIELRIVVTGDKMNDVDNDPFYINNKVSFLLRRMQKKSIFNYVKNYLKMINEFRDLLDSFNPDVVHFASFDNAKPAFFISEAKKRNALVVLQPWTMDFFCIQNYGFRAGKQCHECSCGNFTLAVKHKCLSMRHLVRQRNRFLLKFSSRCADVFLSSNSQLDKILLTYGVEDKKIIRFPIMFNYEAFIAKFYTNVSLTENYFVWYGLPVEEKGLNLILEIFKRRKDLRLKVYPSKPIESLEEFDNIEVINGVSWNSGLFEAVSKAAAVLVPSLWATSTEYSLCEAMALKKAIIAFNVGVHKDILINNKNAIVIDVQTPDKYENALDDVIKKPSLRSVLGLGAFESLVALNNRKVLTEKLFEIYSK